MSSSQTPKNSGGITYSELKMIQAFIDYAMIIAADGEEDPSYYIEKVFEFIASYVHDVH